MTDEHVEPLEPELRALLDTERAATPEAGSLDRVWSRVAMASVSAPVAGGTSGAGRGAASGAGWLASHAAGVATAAFVAGGLAGAGLHAVIRKPPAERIVYVERQAPSAPPVVSPPVASTLPAPAVPSASTSPPSRDGVHAPPVASASSLSAERGILDGARGALGSGDAARALALADEHVRRFPRPQLGEEREAIAIQALAALGRNDEARARAERFRIAAPHSLFLPAIEASLRSIP
jgi:hypothetical protein